MISRIRQRISDCRSYLRVHKEDSCDRKCVESELEVHRIYLDNFKDLKRDIEIILDSNERDKAGIIKALLDGKMRGE